MAGPEQEAGQRQMQTEGSLGGTSVIRRVMAWSLIAVLGVGAGVVTMALTVPASTAVRLAGIALPPDVELAGTALQGVARLRGYEVQWGTLGWPSVKAFSLLADLQIGGPDMQLAGQIRLQPGQVQLAPLQGQIGWSVVEAFMPGMEIRCQTKADVDVEDITVWQDGRRAVGMLQLAAGTCDRVDGTVTGVPLPALTGGLATTDAGVQLVIAGQDAPETPLGNLLLTPDNRLRITVHPAGAAMVPGLPVGGDSQVELPLALFTQ
jgi:hypothetical protein